MSEEILDKKSKLVLKVLNKIKNDDNFVAGSQAVLPYMPKKYNQQIIDEVLWHLEDLGYIECQSSEGHVQYINANYKGQNYRELNLIETKELLCKSVILPIIVSAITSLITIWLTGHFK
jgi:hypothetical protein